MKKGRSLYTFNFTCDTTTMEQVVSDYLRTNSFKPEEKKGEKYYKGGDIMLGYRYFNYSIDGNTLTISAWLRGTLGEIEIEQSGLGSMNLSISEYRNSLNPLFQELDRVRLTGDYTSSTPQQTASSNISSSEPITDNSVSSKFEDAENHKKETMCEVAFWLSIVGLFLSFFGAYYGAIIYILDFYFASQGLKSKKKGKATAAIILSVISIVIIIGQVLMSI